MKVTLSDKQILEGIKAKDTEALNYLYTEYKEKIIKYVINNSGSKEEGEDIFQDAVIKVYKEVQKKDFVLKKHLKLTLPL